MGGEGAAYLGEEPAIGVDVFLPGDAFRSGLYLCEVVHINKVKAPLVRRRLLRN